MSRHCGREARALESYQDHLVLDVLTGALEGQVLPMLGGDASACVFLGRAVPVDILVESAVPWARVAGNDAVARVEPTLDHVCAGLILLLFPEVDTWHCVPPVGPRAVRGTALRIDPQIVTAKRHRSSPELLVLAVGRHVRQTNIG